MAVVTLTDAYVTCPAILIEEHVIDRADAIVARAAGAVFTGGGTVALAQLGTPEAAIPELDPANTPRTLAIFATGPV